MHRKPNYETLRQETPFGWSAAAAYSALLPLAGVGIREFYLAPGPA